MNGSRWPRAVLALLVLVVLTGALVVRSPAASAQDAPASSPDQQLAEKFAPIVMIKRQERRCSPDGEQFRPVAVDIVFGSPDVRLMKRGEGGKSTDTVVKTAPVAADLANLDESHYLDLPGEPRNPGCTYEKWGKERMQELGLKPSLYARVATEEGREGIVVQYWYYWVFNLFNNTHESDWEGIQLSFDAESAQQVLDENLLPSSIAFAQHDGGEQGDWNDDKVAAEGTHIVSHPSSGSHADYYDKAIWLGWGENGSGFGCDYANAPIERLPVEIILLPDQVDPNGEFAWLTYRGIWGERESPSMFSGPSGPNMKPRWDHPISWAEGLRQQSLPVPTHPTIGPGVSQVFCGIAELGSRIVRVYPVNPDLVVFGVIGVLVALLGLAALAWRYAIRAVELYLRHGYVFITTGVLTFPVAVLGQRVENFLIDAVREHGESRLPSGSIAQNIGQYVLRSSVGTVQEILLLGLIAPVVIYATYQLSRRDPVGLERSWKAGAERFPRVLGATLINAVLLTLMALTVVLIPLMIYKAVQWFYAPQAVVVDDARARDARHLSARTVKGHWPRAAAVAVAVAAVSGLPAPLIGTATLILGGRSMNTAEWISALLYCLFYPIGTIAATLFYMNLRKRLEEPVPEGPVLGISGDDQVAQPVPA